MNLAACGQLRIAPLTGTWFRAIQPQFWAASLTTSQTRTVPSRFNEGAVANPPFEVLHLSESPLVALFEVEALLGSPTVPGSVLPHPRRAWTIVNVSVHLQAVDDLTDIGQQALLGTTAQELTGDWRGYQQRNPLTSVPLPVGAAPTQELGAALHTVAGLEGFLTISAKVPYSMNLVVFPMKLQPGSVVEFSHPSLGTQRISG